MIKELLISMRPKQWYKNLIIFIGLIFTFNLFNLPVFIKVTSAFIIFCMFSGSEYLINDIIDKEKDKIHPKKSKRPIASGELQTSYALLFAILFIIGGLIWASSINISFLIISCVYLVLILFYSLLLKNIVIVDILIVSLGFVIRAIAGALVVAKIISPWLIICTFLLALFLILGKRKNELVLLGEEAKYHRKSLEKYSINLINQMMSVITAVLIMSYSLYTFFVNNNYMMLTIPFVIYGFFRYLFLVNEKNFGGEPELLFKDKGILISVLLWTALVVVVLYI